jgi:hypothetical protein
MRVSDDVINEAEWFWKNRLKIAEDGRGLDSACIPETVLHLIAYLRDLRKIARAVCEADKFVTECREAMRRHRDEGDPLSFDDAKAQLREWETNRAERIDALRWVVEEK